MNQKPKSKRVPPSAGLRPGKVFALRCVGWVNVNVDGDEMNRVVYPSEEEARYFAGLAPVEQVRAYIKVHPVTRPASAKPAGRSRSQSQSQKKGSNHVHP